MAGKRDKPEEIVVKLRQVEVLQGQGMSVADAVLFKRRRFWQCRWRRVAAAIFATAGAGLERYVPALPVSWPGRASTMEPGFFALLG
jgi:hypothetical protein